MIWEIIVADSLLPSFEAIKCRSRLDSALAMACNSERCGAWVKCLRRKEAIQTARSSDDYGL